MATSGPTYILLFVMVPYASSYTPSSIPLVVSTWATNGFPKAAQKAWDTLLSTPPTDEACCRRLSALVSGLQDCEERQCDGTVGYGGSPDEEGETTLDAMIMDGPQHRMGAVASLHRIKKAAKVAWAVMNYTKHSLLVGDKATQFAVSMGFEDSNLTTNDSAEMHKSWLAKKCQPNFWKNVVPDPRLSCGPYKPKLQQGNRESEDSISGHHDTIGMIVIDEKGSISAGTSSNGARNKIPGRVGDSPIPGAGAYVDNEVGAAVATGDGDVMVRSTTISVEHLNNDWVLLDEVFIDFRFLAVELMRNGHSPSDAAAESIRRIRRYYPNFFGALVVANRLGDYAAACSGVPSGRFEYSVVNWATGGVVKKDSVACATESIESSGEEHGLDQSYMCAS